MKKILMVIVSVVVLAVPSAALAKGSSTCQSYDQQLCQVASGNATRTTANANASTNANTSSASTLPFTGLDVGLLVAGGAVLLMTGLVVRRFSRGVE